MMYNTQNYWVFGLVHRPVFKKLENNVSEIGSVSVLRWGETPNLLGVIEKPDMNHQTTYVRFITAI
jgi:hypothetical protein